MKIIIEKHNDSLKVAANDDVESISLVLLELYLQNVNIILNKHDNCCAVEKFHIDIKDKIIEILNKYKKEIEEKNNIIKNMFDEKSK